MVGGGVEAAARKSARPGGVDVYVLVDIIGQRRAPGQPSPALLAVGGQRTARLSRTDLDIGEELLLVDRVAPTQRQVQRVGDIPGSVEIGGIGIERLTEGAAVDGNTARCLVAEFAVEEGDGTAFEGAAEIINTCNHIETVGELGVDSKLLAELPVVARLAIVGQCNESTARPGGYARIPD